MFPSADEKKLISFVISQIISVLRKEFPGARIEPIGSAAKGTFLSGDCDIDIYIIDSDIHSAFSKAQKLFPNGYHKQGELLIWNFRFKGFDVDLVFIDKNHPKLDSVQHTKFFNKHLSEEDKREVIRSKAFFKSIGCYGAEIGGITGVAIEELIRQHKTLEAICKFLIDCNPSKVWLQDPVMRRPRNLLASIQKRKWKRIKEKCKQFLQKGSFKFKKYSRNDFLEEFRGFKILEFKRKRERALDYHTAYGVVQKAIRILKGYESDVKVDSEIFVDTKNIIIAVKVVPEVLVKPRVVRIPKRMLWAKQKFEEKHKIQMRVEGDYWVAEVPRKIKEPSKFLVKKIEELMTARGYSQ